MCGGSEPARALPVPTSTPRNTEREGLSREEAAAISKGGYCVSEETLLVSDIIDSFIFVSIYLCSDLPVRYFQYRLSAFMDHRADSDYE